LGDQIQPRNPAVSKLLAGTGFEKDELDTILAGAEIWCILMNNPACCILSLILITQSQLLQHQAST
jgi:hypothetical protein